MTRILVMTANAALAEKIAKLDLQIVSDGQAYRELVGAFGQRSELVLGRETGRRQAPKFGDDRPYLKRKKGRS